MVPVWPASFAAFRVELPVSDDWYIEASLKNTKLPLPFELSLCKGAELLGVGLTPAGAETNSISKHCVGLRECS